MCHAVLFRSTAPVGAVAGRKPGVFKELLSPGTAMRLLRLVPDDTRFDFMRWRGLAFAFTLVLTLVSVALLAMGGLKLGLDFEGGLLVEARSAEPIRIGELRDRLARSGLPELALQSFGDDRDILIRVLLAPGDTVDSKHTVTAITSVLGPSFEIRRSEFIGPQVSHELLVDGITAASLAVALIAVYVWFRFEWQFGLAALITTMHDVVATLGLFLVLRLQFDLTAVAAMLTIAGYSINDTVVVFDRVRENLRRYKKMDLATLINLSVNQMLARTLMTSGTTMLAVMSLLLFGGPVLRNFSAALAWGIAVGTYSSIFVASALLLYFPSVRLLGAGEEPGDAARPPDAPPRRDKAA